MENKKNNVLSKLLSDALSKVEDNFQAEVEFLKEQIQIPSVNGAPVEIEGKYLPFGEAVDEAYRHFMSKGEKMGFSFADSNGYGGHLLWKKEANIEHDNSEGKPSRKTQIFGILGHLDVVPAGEGWTHDPFGGEIEKGYIYGRGSTDDKGPMAASLFAMKALKDAGFRPTCDIRLIAGLDEETNWEGIAHYKDEFGNVDMGFTPDGDFPLVNGEKGLLFFQLVKKIRPNRGIGLRLSRLEGGYAPNIVADKARAVVLHQEAMQYEHIKERANAICAERGCQIETRRVGKSLELKVFGKSAHGAMPHIGINAISVMMEILGELNFNDEKVNELIDFYNRYIGVETDGKALGVYFDDGMGTPTTVNIGGVSLDKEIITLDVNIRFPVSFTKEAVYRGLDGLLNDYDMGIIPKMESSPLYISENEMLPRELLNAYREETNDYDSKPLVIGGGTYAKAMDNILAFGGLFPGDEDRMHQAEERLSLDRFKEMTKIYVRAIYALCGGNIEK